MGPPGLSSRPHVTLLVKHSQSEVIPECDRGHKKIWDGYSLLNTDAGIRAHSQDLGEYLIIKLMKLMKKQLTYT